MLYGIVLTVHVLVCLILVLVILLQAGRGGGLADAFGGAGSSIFGTKGALFLTRATSLCAALFMITSLTLAILSAKKGRSLMEALKPAATQEPAPSASP